MKFDYLFFKTKLEINLGNLHQINSKFVSKRSFKAHFKKIVFPCIVQFSSIWFFFLNKFFFPKFLSVQIKKSIFEISLSIHHKADIITLYRTMISNKENHKFWVKQDDWFWNWFHINFLILFDKSIIIKFFHIWNANFRLFATNCF